MEPRHSEAFALLKDGRCAEALPLLEAIVQDDLADAAVLETLGDVREKLGDITGALWAYQSAVIHLRARGLHTRSVGVLELMMVLAPDNPWALIELAATHAENSNHTSAWKAVADACAALVARGDVAAAIDLCHRHVDGLPSDLTAPSAAVDAIALAGVTAPASRLATALGHALRRQRRMIPALEMYARAVKLDPKNRDAQLARIGGLLAIGQLDDALMAAERAVTNDVSNVGALTMLEKVCSARGDQAGAHAARERLDALALQLPLKTPAPMVDDGTDATREEVTLDASTDLEE